ncbi:ABC transporter permease [Natrialbaceae archaeon A-gly3]
MSRREIPVRVRAVVGLGLTQLRRSPVRTALTVLAVALAVLSVTLLVGLGIGVLEHAEDGLDTADRDVWISGSPVDSPVGGTDNPIVGAHEVTENVTGHENVTSATPMVIQEVYVGADPDDLESRSAVGVYSTHSRYEFEAGGGFETDHSAVDPSSSTPETGEVIVGPELAERQDLEVGDTVYVGTSPESASQGPVTVVGISEHHSQYLGTPAITMPLLDLQIVAGTTGTDRATFVTATVDDEENLETVRDDLAAEYPDYDVHTSEEKPEAVIRDRPVVLASGLTLAGLAVVTGIVLTINLFALVVSQQREQLAALRAIGLSRWTLAGTVGTQGAVIGLLGGLVGLAATPVLATGLNYVAASIVGVESVLVTPLEVYAVGGVVALGVGTIVAVVTGWRAGRYARIHHLEE